MKTFDGYKKRTLTDSNLLLASGGDKPLSDFIGTLNWDSTNRKLQYKKVGDTSWNDLVTFGSNALNSISYLPTTGGTMTGDIAWTTDNHKITFFGNCGISKLSGQGPALIAEGNNWDFWIQNSDNTTRYKLLHTGNTSISGNTITINGVSTTWSDTNDKVTQIPTTSNNTELRPLLVGQGNLTTNSSITTLTNTVLAVPTIKISPASGTISSGAISSGAITSNATITVASGADRKIYINNTDDETYWSIISFQQKGTEYGWLGTTGGINLVWSGNILLRSDNYTNYINSINFPILGYSPSNFVLWKGDNRNIGGSSPAATVKTYWENDKFAPRNMVTLAYNSAGYENTLIFSKNGNANIGNVLRWGQKDLYLYLLKYNGKWETDDWVKIYAGYADSAGKTSKTLTFTGGSTATFNGSTDVSVAIPTVTNYYWANIKVSESSSTSTSPTFGNTTTNKLTISNTEAIGHLVFSRGNYNYITAPTSGIIGFCVNGNTIGSANCEMTISDGNIFPGTTNVTSLGDSSHRWSHIFSIIGDFTSYIKTGSYITFGDHGYYLTSDIRNSWRTSIYGNNASGSRLRTVRTEITIDNFSEIYGSGLAWATGDTQGYLSVSYNSGKAWIGGGNKDKLNWSTYLVTGNNIGSQSVHQANQLKYTGLAQSVFTVAQTSDDFCGRSGWATYLIGNHGDGSTYYHQVIAMPFDRMPQYQRLENGKQGAWYTFAMMGYANSGDLYAAHFYENSDIRYKHNIKNRIIEITNLASLPIFDYTWEDSIEINTGTSAQAVQEILPNIVSGTDKLTLDYGVLGTIAGITACKELVAQKSEIDLLKDRIEQLEQQLKMINDYGRC